MAKHVWIIWVAVELAVVLMLAALWPANASAASKWNCISAGYPAFSPTQHNKVKWFFLAIARDKVSVTYKLLK
jgi:hypothetical protein